MFLRGLTYFKEWYARKIDEKARKYIFYPPKNAYLRSIETVNKTVTPGC